MTSTGRKRKREVTVKASEVRIRWAELLEQVRFEGVTVRVRHYKKVIARIVPDDGTPETPAA